MEGLEPPLDFTSPVYKTGAVATEPHRQIWRKLLKEVYTEGIEPSCIDFESIVLTISRSNSFSHHPFLLSWSVTIRLSLPCQSSAFPLSYRTIFEVLTGFEPVWVILQITTSRLSTPLGHSTICWIGRLRSDSLHDISVMLSRLSYNPIL